MGQIFGTQSVVTVPERWQRWAEKCREQAPSSRKWYTAVLAMFDHSAARWIEDVVPDSERAIRVNVTSDEDAANKVVQALDSPQFRADDKKAMVSAFLCRAYNVAASVEADPLVPIAVRTAIKTGREEQW